MTEYVDLYWKKRIEKCKEALEKNNFEVFLAETPSDANNLIVKRNTPNYFFS